MRCCATSAAAVLLSAVLCGVHWAFPLDENATWYFDTLFWVGLHTVAFVDGSRLRPGRGLDLPAPGANLQGKAAVITGSTKGIGFHAARRFHALGADVVVSGRKKREVDSSAAWVRSYSPGAGKTLGIPLDLADFGSVRAFAEEVVESFPAVQFLVMNAAMASDRFHESGDTKYWMSKSGHSRVFAANHLGHFLLTLLLAPYLAQDASVVLVGSMGAWWANPKGLMVDFGTPPPNITQVPFEKRAYYLAGGMYDVGKYASVCFANTLRHKVTSRGVRVVVMTPGLVSTDINVNNVDYQQIAGFAVSPEEGGRALFESAFVTRATEFVYPYWFSPWLYSDLAPVEFAPRAKGSKTCKHFQFEGPRDWLWRPEKFQRYRYRLHASVAPECNESTRQALWYWSRSAVDLPERLDDGDVFDDSADLWQATKRRGRARARTSRRSGE